MHAPLQLIDTHVHVQSAQFDDDRALVLERAAAAGVVRLLEIGYDLESSRAALALAEQHSHIRAVVGVQPNHAADLPDDWLAQVHALALHPKVAAIGEIGFDHYWKRATPARQETVFRVQLELAQALALPVVIHSRDAQADTLRVLGDMARGTPGIMHSFSGDPDYAAACLAIGFHLSFSGPVTFAKAAALHEAVRQAPLDRILTETDSPYLAPHPWRGRRNEPAYVRLVAERLAALRGITLEELAAAVWQNAGALFKWEA